MAKKRPPNKIPEGWKKVQFYVPEHVTVELKQTREQLPEQSLKLLGTAAISLIVSLPDACIEALYSWAHSTELRPEDTRTENAYSTLLEFLGRDAAILAESAIAEAFDGVSLEDLPQAERERAVGRAFPRIVEHLWDLLDDGDVVVEIIRKEAGLETTDYLEQLERG